MAKNAVPSAQQQLPFCEQSAKNNGIPRNRSIKTNGERYLQDILWKESLLAVKMSTDCQTVAELISRLQETLPQNSAITRQRNTSTILSRFFPTAAIEQFPRQVLLAYDDEELVAAVMRVLFLEAEPLVGKLVAERLHRLPTGSELPKDFFLHSAQGTLGKREKRVSTRCCTAVRALGWTIMEKKHYYIAQQTPNETAALLIFHHRYAPTPRVIDLKALLAEPTWKYLGFSHEDAVRGFMRKLEQRRLVARYADAEAQHHWTTLLTASIQQAGGFKVLFQGAEVDHPQRVTARANQVRYEGERVIVSGWSMVWGNPVVDKTNYALHFRMVYLLDQAEVDPQALHDDRLAVVIPGKWEEIARDSSRRYTALVKMQEEYQGKQGPEAEDIKRFIDTESQKARGDIVLTQKQLYRAGHIVTRAGLGIDPKQAFADPEKADEIIASALLANAYTACPFDTAAFRKEFSTAEAGKIFGALFGGSTQSGDVSAVENFGLGLGLTSAKNPKAFDPAPCTFFATIREELARAGGELRLYSFYEKYTNAPYGLLEDMITLYLLAFVRFAQPHCYLTVKPEVGLKLKSGKAPLDNRLGPADVVQVTWARARLHRTLDRLVQAVGPSWNDLVEFARVFDDSLKATTERQEVESQQDRFRKAQQQWHEKIERIHPRLQRLARAAQGNFAPYTTLLGQVDTVCCTTTLEDFEHALKEQFERDKEAFSTAVGQVKDLDELDRLYDQPLLDALAYLAELEGIPQASPLTMERDLVQTRFAFEAFCKQPSQAGAVLKVFEQFTHKYRTQYQIHYRQYRQQLAVLDTRLKKLTRKVDGLGRMNQIEELGGAVGTDLLMRYQDLLARCTPQELPEALPEVKDRPLFRGITLSTTAPEQEVADFEERLEDALQTRFWQIADETITAILTERGDTPLHALLEAIQAADVTKLAEHFTAEIADLVRQVLRDARLVTVDVRLADYDGPAQLGDDPKELEDVMTALAF